MCSSRSPEIERVTGETDIHLENIGFCLFFEEGNELGAILSSDEETTSSEGIECTCMPHFFDTSESPELAYDIKTRDSEWLIDEIKHEDIDGLFAEFRIGCCTWAREKSRCWIPSDIFPIGDPIIPKNMKVSKINEHSPEDIRAFYKVSTHISDASTVTKTRS
jgi:hypothetical protein